MERKLVCRKRFRVFFPWTPPVAGFEVTVLCHMVLKFPAVPAPGLSTDLSSKDGRICLLSVWIRTSTPRIHLEMLHVVKKERMGALEDDRLSLIFLAQLLPVMQHLWNIQVTKHFTVFLCYVTVWRLGRTKPFITLLSVRWTVGFTH